MLRRFLTYISLFAALLLSSCSDEIDFQPASSPFGPDGTVEFNISVPGMSATLSRDIEVDPEYKVNHISLLLYPADATDATAPAQAEKIYLDPASNDNDRNRLEQVSPTTLRLSFKLNNSLRSGGFKLYAIANVPDGVDLTAATIKNLKEKTLTAAQLGSAGNLVMMTSATSESLATAGTNTLSLYRVTAKVSVTDKKPEDGVTVKYYPTLLCGQAVDGYLVSPIFSGTDYYCPSVAPASFPESLGDSDAVSSYFPQTLNSANADGFGGNLYVIVKAAYGIDEYYYRLDFCEKTVNDDNTVTYSYLSTEANHWYQFIITEVTGPGYATPALAALHPENTVKYVIHDHCPESLNMTSDGFRELGVSHDIEYEGTDTPEGEWSEISLYIKLFSRDDSEIPATPSAVKELVTVENSWLVLGDPVEVSADEVTGGAGPADDPNDRGKVYRLPIRFNNTTLPGTLYNKISVSWLGLHRDIAVTWERRFNGAEVTSASLSMKLPWQGTTKIADYWSFLSSTDDPETVTGSNNLWGVQTEANNGKVRNEGFHFPVMYGTYPDYARYTYTLTFDRGKFADSSLNYTASYTVTGDIKNYVTVSQDQTKPAKFTISYTTDNYNYLTGKLNITITYNTSPATSEVYSYDLYHTGFFHEDDQENRMDARDPGNYYYYEVVPVTIDGRTRYMLDRNLAARSAQDFILDSDGATVTGNPAAAGGYYKVAAQVDKYKDPVLLERVCPPGYVVPEKSVWDAVRLSTSFHTAYDGRYYPAYYECPEPIGRVYFPKSMMMVDNAITGESRSGYYWTSTAASGTEKDEIGRWLNMFMLTGASSSFINGYVIVQSHENQAFGAPVRCFNRSSQEFSTMRTAFNVSGATHVYLYNEDGNEERTATTTWPGHAIGNYVTMAPGNWFGFSYESTQFSPEQLKVIFNFVDEQGIIHSFSKGDGGATLYTTTLALKDLTGWDVTGDTDPNIVPSSGMTVNPGTVNEVKLGPATSTGLNQWWYCQSTTPFVRDYKKNTFRILYLTGLAVPSDWSLNPGTCVYAVEENVYVWEGELKVGEFKGYWYTDGDWNQPFLRPVVYGQQLFNISSTGISEGDLKWEAGGNDDKWNVTAQGRYRLTFNLNTMKFKFERLN